MPKRDAALWKAAASEGDAEGKETQGNDNKENAETGAEVPGARVERHRMGIGHSPISCEIL